VHRANARDLAAGILVTVIGLLFLAGAMGLRFGTTRNIGPGFFPIVLSIILIGQGILLTASSFKTPGDFPKIAWRPLLLVAGAIAAFIVALLFFGAVPAVMATVIVGSLAEGRPSFSIFALAVFLALAIWLTFVVGLGVPMPALRSPFG